MGRRLGLAKVALRDSSEGEVEEPRRRRRQVRHPGEGGALRYQRPDEVPGSQRPQEVQARTQRGLAAGPAPQAKRALTRIIGDREVLGSGEVMADEAETGRAAPLGMHAELRADRGPQQAPTMLQPQRDCTEEAD